MTHTETAAAASTGVGASRLTHPVRLTHSQNANVTMLVEALLSLTPAQRYAAIYQFEKEQPASDPLGMHTFANRMSRLADEKERG